MLWSVAFAVLMLALLIPVLAVVFDAPFLRRQRSPQAPTVAQSDDRLELLAKRLLNLEDEVDDLSHTVNELRDELQYLQRLVDTGQSTESPKRLGPPEA
jgi:hypothetical protein